MDANELFEQNYKLVYFVVKKLTSRYSVKESQHGLEIADMEQIGAIGLWKACTRFDTKFNLKFSTYAVPTIMGEILKEIRDRSGLLKVSRQSKLIAKKLADKLDEGEKFNALSVKNEFKCSLEIAQTAIDMLYIKFLSMDSQIDDEDNFGGATYELPDYESDFVNKVIRKEELNERLSILDEREKKVIYMSMDEMTQSEIAKVIGLSQVQVSRILKKALKKINNVYEVNAYENEPQLA